MRAICTTPRETGNPKAAESSSCSASSAYDRGWLKSVTFFTESERFSVTFIRTFGHSCLVTRDTCEKLDVPSALTAATRNSMAMKRGGGWGNVSEELLRADEFLAGTAKPSACRAAVIDAGQRDGARTRHSGNKWA